MIASFMTFLSEPTGRVTLRTAICRVHENHIGFIVRNHFAGTIITKHYHGSTGFGPALSMTIPRLFPEWGLHINRIMTSVKEGRGS
jgi:hypothetical protein